LFKPTGHVTEAILLGRLRELGGDEKFGSLRKETFNPTEYARWVRAFETQQTGSLAGSRVEYALRSYWMEHQPAIHTVLTSLEELAGVRQGRSGPYVICHADLLPGNILRDPDGHLFVVDWDDVLAGFDLWVPLIYPR
jgi:spectinomycin phosphotransferase